MTNCANCGRPIGDLETKEVHGENVVCTECKQRITANPMLEYVRPAPPGTGMATASMILGIIGLLAWCVPIIGLPLTITGLVLGIKSTKAPNPGSATAGIVMNTIGLVASVINAAIGAYLGATGHIHF